MEIKNQKSKGQNQRALAAGALFCAAIFAGAARADGKLDDVLAHMDAVAEKFTGAEAQVSYTQVTVIVNDRSTQSGGFYLSRDKKGYKVLIEFRQPDEENILFKDGKAEIYKPKIEQKEVYDVGKEYNDIVKQYLMIGFGGRVKDMREGYRIELAGDEKINGADAVKLALTPKEGMANKRVVELWISRANWLPVQQRSTDPATKDYLEIVYSNVQPQAVPDKKFELHTTSKTKVVHPAK